LSVKKIRPTSFSVKPSSGSSCARANRAGRGIDRKRLTRRQFERFLDSLEAGTEVVMEACGTAHYWGRRCQARDLRVRLLPVQ